MAIRSFGQCLTWAAIGGGLFVSAGADWPQFRGPGAAGVAGETGLPVEWNDATGIAWQTELPGPGSSSPITLGDRIYITCYSGYGVDREAPGELKNLQRHLVCLDRNSGAIRWTATAEAPLPEQEYTGFMQQHGYASSTPATDGERVYVFNGAGGVLAYDLDGEQLWQTSVGSGTHMWGVGSSPVVSDDLVIVNASVESGSIVALDKKTGKEVWRHEGVEAGWGSPALVETADGATELVLMVKDRVFALDPATGEELWSCQGPDSTVCTTPVSKDGVVYISGGRATKTMAVRSGGRGDVTDTHVVWEQQGGSNIPSPTLYDGKLFLIDARGVALCFDAATGEPLHKGRLADGGRVYASLLAADEKLYCVTRENGVYVLAAAPSMEVLSHNELTDDDTLFQGSPAPNDGRLLMRSDKMLYCIGPGGDVAN